ncbi:MAG: MauE/DoxX family redox-associated membrane protein [Pseudomonadota bacterium]
MELWLLVIAWTFVGVLTPAAVHKVKDHARFKAMVGAYKIVPEFLLTLAAISIALLEVLTITLLIFQPVIGLVLATGLFAVYLLAILINLMRDRAYIDCGCGDDPVPLSWRIVARNACLVVSGLFAILIGPGLMNLADFMIALPMAVVAVVLYHGFEQLIQNSANRSKLFGVTG